MYTLKTLSLLIVLFIVSCENSGSSSPDRRVISTEAAPEAIGPYSQAIQVGNTIYCSGQIGIDPETEELVDGGIKAETHQTLSNLKAVLQAADASLSDVVQVQVFLTSLDDYQAMNEIYNTYFETAPPARTAIEAANLPAGARVEIVVTAQK